MDLNPRNRRAHLLANGAELQPDEHLLAIAARELAAARKQWAPATLE